MDYVNAVFVSGSVLAHRAVHMAVKKGQIPPATVYKCVDCGRDACQYEHRSYDKPLDVAPVCRSCNRRRGKALPKVWKDEEELLNYLSNCKSIAKQVKRGFNPKTDCKAVFAPTEKA
jgi:hypothetical protein